MDPDTALFDTSTGEWVSAAEAPVVRFILNEMERDGLDIPPGWDVEPPEALEASEAALSVDSVAPDEEAKAPTEKERDPLELGLTLTQAENPDGAPTDPEGRPLESDASLPTVTASTKPPPTEPVPASPEAGSPALEGRSSQAEPDEVEVASSGTEVPYSGTAAPGHEAPSKEWVTPRSEGGLFAGVESSESVTSDEPAVDRHRGASSAGRRGRTLFPLDVSRLSWRTGLVVAGLAVVVAGLLARSGAGNEEAESSPPAGEVDVELSAALGAAALPVPAGQQEAARRSADLIVQRYQTAADSIRSALSLPLAPPGPWLSGFYLANAGDFPEVPEYWEDYGRLVEELRLIDRALFLDVLDQGLGPAVVAPTSRSTLESYLRDRYGATLPARQQLYDQLGSVAMAALDLHAFLIDAGTALEYTPALGTAAVARDPVLEIGVESPELREALDEHLDELFSALDRSRGGGAPSLSGLRQELFGLFAPF